MFYEIGALLKEIRKVLRSVSLYFKDTDYMWYFARFGNNFKKVKSTHGGVLLLVY